MLPPPDPTISQDNRPLIRDPEFYQFDRGDQRRGGREKTEKYVIGKGVGKEKGGGGGEKGVVGGETHGGEKGERGGGEKGGRAGQMTRPTGSPFYSDFLLEEDVQQGGIRGRRKYPSNPPSISFPHETPSREPDSPVQFTAKAEGGFWNTNLNDVDSAWKPSLPYLTPTKEDYGNDNAEAMKDAWKLGENLRQYIREGGEENNNNFGFNDVVDNKLVIDKSEHMKGNNEKKSYTEKEGEDFKDSLNTLLTGDRSMNLKRVNLRLFR